LPLCDINSTTVVQKYGWAATKPNSICQIKIMTNKKLERLHKEEKFVEF